jgi:hypothetical protein
MMIRNAIRAAAIAATLFAAPAFAQTSPNFTFGFVPTTAQWNALFANKQDFLGAAPLLTTGGTMTGPLLTAASTAINTGFNIPPGTAPTTPNNGDMWTTTAGLFVQINGATIGPLTEGAAGSFTGTSPVVASFPGAGVVNFSCPTCGVTGSPLSQFAATTSAQLAGVLTNETGTGLVVFNNSPTLITPSLGAASATSLALSGALTYGGVTLNNAVTGTGNMVLSASPTHTGTITAAAANFSGTVNHTGAFQINGTTETFPASGLIAGTTDTQTLTNKTLASSTDVIGGVTTTLGSDATGDIYFRNSSGVLTRLPIGGTGNILNVSAGLPAWTTPAGGGNVSNSGTPTSGQIAQWISATQIQGVSLASQLTNANVQTGSLSPTGTGSTTGVMMGLGLTGCTITPVLTGRVLFEIAGTSSNTTTVGTTSTLRFGTGTAPSNAAAPTGTQIGAIYRGTPAVANGGNPITMAGITTGLALGTAVWFDADILVTSGTGSIVVACIATEF